MKGNDLKLFWTIIILSFFIGMYIFDKTYNLYSDIITFLSIMIGFKITSISILYNSPLKKSLYDRKNNVYETELHRLNGFYKHSLFFEVISVTSLFIITNLDYKYLLIFPIVLGTLFCFYKTTSELLKIFVHPTNN